MEQDKVEPSEPGKVVLTNIKSTLKPKTPGQEEKEKREWIQEHKLNG
jgi:hypothetical protein